MALFMVLILTSPLTSFLSGPRLFSLSQPVARIFGTGGLHSMRGNELLDKMELIDPSFVEAADKKNRKKHVAWMKWGVAAACLGLVSFGLWSLLQKQTQIP